MSTLKVNTIQDTSGKTQYTAKAWVNFNGTGTPSIRASGNVSSITDNGTGNYGVNFTNAMPDANYCAIFNGGRMPNTDVMAYAIDESVMTASYCKCVGPKQVGVAITDSTLYTFVAFR